MFVFLFAHQTHMTYYSSTTHSKVKILKEIKICYKYYHRLIHVSGLISPGQGASLQLCVSERSWVEQPWSHVLVLVCSPDPHDALQLDQLLHVEKSKRLVIKGHSNKIRAVFNFEHYLDQNTLLECDRYNHLVASRLVVNYLVVMMKLQQLDPIEYCIPSFVFDQYLMMFQR